MTKAEDKELDPFMARALNAQSARKNELDGSDAK
jgi:hypothetical protein